MSPAEQQLLEDRAVRDAARAVFDTRLARVRAALAARGLGQRVKAEAMERAVAGADEAVAVVCENRAVVAGTALALVAWVARRPLVRWVDKLVRYLRGGEPASRRARWREWTVKRIRT